MTDYSTARYFAISGIGYGKGFTAEEAVENYVKTFLRLPARDTVYETQARWEEALRNGDFKAQVWQAPEGWTGFVLGTGLSWTREVNGTTEYRDAQPEERVEL